MSIEASSEAIHDIFYNSSYYSKESKPITRLPSQNYRNTHKSINVRPLKSRNINTKFDVEVPVLPETAVRRKIEAEQIEAKSQRRLQILKKQIEIEEAQAFDTVSEAREKVRIAQMLENLRDIPPINTRIKKPSSILPVSEGRLKQSTQRSSSHPISVHPTQNFTERDTVIRRQLTPYKAKKAKSTAANESPERSVSAKKYRYQIPKHITQSIDHFIDLVVEGQETNLDIQRKEATATSLLQMELESKNLPPIELTRFGGDHSKWLDFIQNFKNRVHVKQSFTDDIRMERLFSVLVGDAKRAVAAVEHSG